VRCGVGVGMVNRVQGREAVRYIDMKVVDSYAVLLIVESVADRRGDGQQRAKDRIE
jgi:hypothetical protein